MRLFIIREREREEKYQDLEELNLPQLCKSMHFRFEKGPRSLVWVQTISNKLLFEEN